MKVRDLLVHRVPMALGRPNVVLAMVFHLLHYPFSVMGSLFDELNFDWTGEVFDAWMTMMEPESKIYDLKRDFKKIENSITNEYSIEMLKQVFTLVQRFGLKFRRFQVALLEAPWFKDDEADNLLRLQGMVDCVDAVIMICNFAQEAIPELSHSYS